MLVQGTLSMADFGSNSATYGARGQGSRGEKLMTAAAFGGVGLSVFCQCGCSALLDGRPGQATSVRAGVPQPPPGPHRGAHHVAHWPAGLEGPRAGMAGPGLFGGSGNPARPKVEESMCSHRAAAS